MQIKQTRRVKVSKLAAFTLAACVIESAQATDGYLQHGYGVKSQGIGGVGIALAQDGLAAAANPAGAVFLGDRFDLGLSWFSPKRSADIVGNAAPVNGSYDGNGKKNFYIPEFGLVEQIAPGLAAGIAVVGNGGMNTRYRSGIPLFGRSEAGVNLEQLFVSPHIAWKVAEHHAVGAALNFAWQRFEARGLANFDNPMFSNSPGYVTDRGVDTSTGWGLRLGYTGQLTPEFAIGATWSSKIAASRFDKYRGLFADGGAFDIPQNYGIGAAWKITPGLTVAADIERILYGKIASVGAPLANFARAPLGAAGGPGFGWKDIAVHKIGLAYDFSPSLSLRAGYNHAGQPVPASETLFNILAPGVVQKHLSVGGTLRLADRDEISIAYTRAFKTTVEGVNSIPQSFGGGNANLSLEEHMLGIAYGVAF
jgi:long-chain fatty acid transport protein